ncbi:two-component system sensor histidine kinase NtrB [Alicyclobacillus fodiniaquatilis]|uniref:histidine kinase n=1 Tax=Alicyclobacillus fodiniaquatilis TaxID=1661150 RepID=A0ABW4JB55_9BACL
MTRMLRRETHSTTLTELFPDTQLLNAAIFYVSKEDEVTLFNDLAADLLGQPKIVGRTVPLANIFMTHSEEYQMLHHVVATECEYRDAIVKWEIGGTVRHVLLDTFTRQSEDGHIQGMYVAMKDLGNFAMLEQQTQRIEKMETIGKLAAGIAHEIRNPLTTVKGFLQVLEHRLQDGLMDDEVQYVQVMMSEIERVNALVSELLLLSKPHKVAWTTFSMRDLLAELLPWVQSTARDHGVDFGFDIADDIQMQADRDMIRQLLLHLVRNAIEAMDVGGCVNISVKASGEGVEIEITDTGPGIPYYLVDKIFDAFYTTKDTGTGLGLAICQRIVADHGGQIRVSSKGYGTTFTVSLPNLKQGTSGMLVQGAGHTLSVLPQR